MEGLEWSREWGRDELGEPGRGEILYDAGLPTKGLRPYPKSNTTEAIEESEVPRTWIAHSNTDLSITFHSGGRNGLGLRWVPHC